MERPKSIGYPFHERRQASSPSGVAKGSLRRRLQRRPIGGGAALPAWRLIGDEHDEAGNVEKGRAIPHNAFGRSDRLGAGRADRIGRRLRGQPGKRLLGRFGARHVLDPPVYPKHEEPSRDGLPAESATDLVAHGLWNSGRRLTSAVRRRLRFTIPSTKFYEIVKGFVGRDAVLPADQRSEGRVEHLAQDDPHRLGRIGPVLHRSAEIQGKLKAGARHMPPRACAAADIVVNDRRYP